jgi:predicted RNase H-like nuclease (RuvC/YqgF family)
MSEASETPAEIDRLDSIQDIERLLLDAAKAVQRIMAERDALRSRVDIMERELARLRHQTALIHDSYRRLATEFVTQVQLLDREVNNLAREPAELLAEQHPAETATSSSGPAFFRQR